MSEIYNVSVPVVALIRAESEAEAIRLFRRYIDSHTPLDSLPVAVPCGAFLSEDVPEDHVLKLEG